MLSITDNAAIPTRGKAAPGTAVALGYAILKPAMKLLLGLAIVLLIAISVFADYKWKQWMSARKQDRDRSN
jgi:hypothetical protein